MGKNLREGAGASSEASDLLDRLGDRDFWTVLWVPPDEPSVALAFLDLFREGESFSSRDRLVGAETSTATCLATLLEDWADEESFSAAPLEVEGERTASSSPTSSTAASTSVSVGELGPT